MTAYDIELAARSRIPKELLNEASSLHLAMQLSSDMIQATLADVASGRQQWSESFMLERKNDVRQAVRFIQERNWSERVFRKCTLTFNCKNFTLVPAAFYNEAMAEDALRFNTTADKEICEHLFLPMAEAYMIYGIPEALAALSANFPNLRMMPSVFPLALSAEREVSRRETKVIVFVEADYMALVVFKEGNLQLLNYFDVTGHEDVLYYLTSVFMRLKLDQESTEILLTEDGRHIQLYKTLSAYYPNLSAFVQLPAESGHAEKANNYMPYLQIQCV